MRTHTNEEREESYNKLPEVLKEALYGPDIANVLFDTGKKFGLTIEQIGFLAEEAGTLVLGLTKPSEFVSTIQERLGIDSSKSREIAKEINSQIFFPLREALKAAHQIEITEEEIAKAEVFEKPRPISPPPPPQPKIEIAPLPRPVSPTPPSPADLSAKASASAEALAKEGKPPPAMVKLPEPIKPPAVQPKIPPIDLRRAKPERMREAIFAPPIFPEETPKETPMPEKKVEPPKPPDGSSPLTTGKKAPYGGYDPYRESAE